MVKINFTNRFTTRILFWIIFIIFFSCENPLLFNKCPDCYHTEPLNSEIKAKLNTTTSQGMPTTIQIYEGTINDGILLGSYKTSSTEWRFSVKLNKLYTVTATYYMNGIFYTGVDAVNPGVRYEKVLCDQPCFLVINNELDLRIKVL